MFKKICIINMVISFFVGTICTMLICKTKNSCGDVFSDFSNIISIILGAYAIYQAKKYNEDSKATEKQTKQLNTNTNMVNMYSLIRLREIYDIISESNKLDIYKDVIVLVKNPGFSQENAKIMEILHDSSLIKKCYENSIYDFLYDKNTTSKTCTLRRKIVDEDIEKYMRMYNKLLKYDISLLHNIHYDNLGD